MILLLTFTRRFWVYSNSRYILAVFGEQFFLYVPRSIHSPFFRIPPKKNPARNDTILKFVIFVPIKLDDSMTTTYSYTPPKKILLFRKSMPFIFHA